MEREPTEMELRVARALYDGRNLGAEAITSALLPQWEDLHPLYRRAWVLKARAAIRAMREPTNEMFLTIEYISDWYAMIDAASPPAQTSES